MVTAFVDFLITLGLLAALMLWYGVAPGWQLLTLPLFVLLAFGLSLGLGLLLAALNVEYRDFRYIVPFIVQFGLFISPIAFTTANVPGALADAVRAQSDGGHHRRLPVVDPRRPAAARARGDRAVGGRHRVRCCSWACGTSAAWSAASPT